MAISNAAQRQGEAASTLPREQVIECLAELEHYTERFIELPEIFRAFDRLISIRGRGDCPDPIEEIVDDFVRFDFPPAMRLLMDGVQHQVNNLTRAQDRVTDGLGITFEEIRAYRERFEGGC